VVAAAGITGPAIYRHFDGKSAVLVALIDRVIDDLTSDATRVVSSGADPATMLRELIASHVRIVIEDHTLMRVYHSEIASLPAADSRRLRRRQRLYVEEWVRVLALLRPEASDPVLRALVHAAIGAIQSTLFYRSDLRSDQVAGLMADVAAAALFAPAQPG
jgi:AcrR family transcriptional regulator